VTRQAPLRITLRVTVLVGCVAWFTVPFLPPVGVAVVLASANRSAVIVGAVVEVGGPMRSQESQRRTYALVAVRRADGRLVATAHATPQAGFKFRLVPGRYQLSIDTPLRVSGGCPPATVVAKAYRATWVRVNTGCAES
jgi:hypothetical protein